MAMPFSSLTSPMVTKALNDITVSSPSFEELFEVYIQVAVATLNLTMTGKEQFGTHPAFASASTYPFPIPLAPKIVRKDNIQTLLACVYLQSQSHFYH